jgi:hypothetical protein
VSNPDDHGRDRLTARSFDARPTGVADLCSLRLAMLHETDADRHLAEGTVKRLTSRPTLPLPAPARSTSGRDDLGHPVVCHQLVLLGSADQRS